jgi:hypothetical protein
MSTNRACKFNSIVKGIIADGLESPVTHVQMFAKASLGCCDLLAIFMRKKNFVFLVHVYNFVPLTY